MKLESHVPLRERTSLKLGGPARYFVEVESEADLVEALGWARAQGERVFVLGGGSNIVLPDEGLAGLVLAIASKGVTVEPAEAVARVHAAAGEAWDGLVALAVARDLAGIECLSGIPGSVGATPIQNVGAYGQEVSDTIRAVRAFDREQERFVELDAGACEFGYRSSRFKAREPGRFVVTRVTFALVPGGAARVRYPELARKLATEQRPASLRAVREAVLELRRAKSMLLDADDPNGRSCGSFFLNPVVDAETAAKLAERFARIGMPQYPQPDGRIKLSAAWLIERAGFEKGLRRGRVGISSRHALALVCEEGATSSELRALSRAVQRGVLEQTGIELSPEALLW